MQHQSYLPGKTLGQKAICLNWACWCMNCLLVSVRALRSNACCNRNPKACLLIWGFRGVSWSNELCFYKKNSVPPMSGYGGKPDGMTCHLSNQHLSRVWYPLCLSLSPVPTKTECKLHHSQH